MHENLIKLFYEAKEVADKRCDNMPNCDECPACGKCYDCMDWLTADELIANGVTVQRWIPVTERLPMLYERVLTCRLEHNSGSKHICHEYRTTSYGETLVWCLDLDTWKSEVTHWMPLPEPPKGE